MKDQLAIVGVGSTGYGRDLGRSAAALAIDACSAAIHDAGLEAKDINGIGSLTHSLQPPSMYMQVALGIPECTWFVDDDRAAPVTHCLGLALNAVFSGIADVVLLYHSVIRLPSFSRSAARDPMRVRSDRFSESAVAMRPSASVPSVHVGYGGLMSRYIHELSASREDFGHFVINARSNAAKNPLAAMQSPITMEDYLAAPMIDDPMCLFDMDFPVDGSDAFVITTIERARDLPKKPVMVHAISDGRLNKSGEGDLNLEGTGQEVAARSMWKRSDLRLGDVDVFLPYDGYSFSGMMWLEDVGYCDRGEAGAFMRQHWDPHEQRILIDGRIPVNSHGGSLAGGRSRGASHLAEAVVQLRGEAGARQAPGARTALVSSGTFLQNPNCVLLRASH